MSRFVAMFVAVVVIVAMIPSGESASCPALTAGTGQTIKCSRAAYGLIIGIARPVDCTSKAAASGTTATFACASGFTRDVTYNKVSCRANGSWGKTLPTCVEVTTTTTTTTTTTETPAP